MSYQIAWRNLDTGKTGLGPKKFEDEAEVEALVEEMNEEYPGFEHTVVASGMPPEFKTMPKSEPRQDPYRVFTDDTPMPFGEHKDKPMRDVPSAYLDWFRGWDGRHMWPGILEYIEQNKKAIDQDLEREGL